MLTMFIINHVNNHCNPNIFENSELNFFLKEAEAGLKLKVISKKNKELDQVNH